MIKLIDNYDSFTYNLVQYFGDLGQAVDVVRNDCCSVQNIINERPSAIVISPGPGTPDKAGICIELVKLAAANDIPLLGVCLGHQAIGQAFGGKIIKASRPVHGKTDIIRHSNSSIFKGLPEAINITRYHSLIIERETIPDSLVITAQTSDNIIMGVMHKTKPVHGVQFHPESIATENGHDMLKNFLNVI